jgi:hypothetical protein
MAQFITAITIELETFTPQATVIRIVADDLYDTLKTTEEWHAFIMQTDQQIMVGESIPTLIQYDRHLFGFASVAPAVWNEGSGRKMPEQFVQCIVGGGIGRADDRMHSVLHRLVGQLASGAKLVGGTSVEIHFGHYFGVIVWRFVRDGSNIGSTAAQAAPLRPFPCRISMRSQRCPDAPSGSPW